MYAVVEDGSRQYRVSKGDVVRLDYRDVEVGDEVVLDKILLFQEDSELHIGRPMLEGAQVIARVVAFPSVKVYIQKFRRRKNYRRFTGHRQPYIAVKVLHLLLAGQERPADEEMEDQTTMPAESEEAEDQYEDEGSQEETQNDEE